MAHLLPASEVSSLEHIRELTEALDVAQINFICYHFVEQELGTELTIILKN